MIWFPIVALAALSADRGPVPIAVAVPNRDKPVSYAKEVSDILDAKCVGCHNAWACPKASW